MKNFKKVIIMCLAMVLVAALAIGGTIAYLQDSDSDVNVMTLGNVKIEQHEYEREVDANGNYVTDSTYGYVLKDFTQAKPLFPATEIDSNGNPYNYGAGDYDSTRVKMSQVGSHGSMDVFVNENAIDKFVTVENTGKTDAYVRTIIAMEIGSLTEARFDEVISTSSFMTEQGVWKVTDIGIVVIDGNNYFVCEYIYNGAKALGGVHENGVLPAGETSYPNLCQVYMKSNATNKDCEALDGNDNGTYDVLVFSQAVQAAGFADAETALDTAFGKSSEKAAEWFGGVLDSQDFAGGAGTKELPYLIDEPAQLMNISNYDEYTYFKVADGVDTLDMTGVGRIRLNGSFDGNGVTMNNLTTALFEYVGKSGEAQDIKISNLTANVNTTDGRGLVRNIFNPGTTTFENVALHGYIEGQYNMGSFYNYGTANSGDSEGADYTVNFVNATSDVTLVNTTGNAIGGMLGHGYEGANYKLYINMDDASGYTGQMYTTGTATCYEVMAMCSHATYILNGVEVSRYSDTYPSTRLTAVAPVAGADGYYVAPVAGVDHYVVSLETQLTAYDENDVKIPNMAGLTWSLGKKTVTSEFDGKVLDLVTSAEIVNDENKPIGYEIDGGVLKAYTGRNTNYKSGWFTLNVTQYDANGMILATGNLRVFTIDEP